MPTIKMRMYSCDCVPFHLKQKENGGGGQRNSKIGLEKACKAEGWAILETPWKMEANDPRWPYVEMEDYQKARSYVDYTKISRNRPMTRFTLKEIYTRQTMQMLSLVIRLAQYAPTNVAQSEAESAHGKEIFRIRRRSDYIDLD